MEQRHLQISLHRYNSCYMTRLKILFSIFTFICLSGNAQLTRQTITSDDAASLPRSTPEAEGISSHIISVFLDSIAKSKHEFHSFMLVRHGKVIAEGWWNPYRRELKHTLYSLSKTFTATAVGFARAEGKLSLKDKVVSFFPDELPVTVSEYLKGLTITDLLTMSVGHERDPTGRAVQDSNWVKSFLATPIKDQPGTKFLYNSMATYMLSAIVQKVTGQKVIEYLQPRLFDPLGIEEPDWENDPRGISTGGWGLRLKTEDIAKFAQLFLQKGKWKGRQVLPAGWVEEASSAHIIQHPEYSKARRDSSDWEQGYGYQMWRSRYNAFRGDGAVGQYAIVMPEQDAVIAITSETASMQGELDLIWKLILPAMHSRKLPADKKANDALRKKLTLLALPVKKNYTVASSPALLKFKTFNIESNPLRIQSISLSFQDSICRMNIKTDTSNYAINFAANSWQLGETNMHGPYLVNAAKNKLAGLPPFKVAGEYTWIDANTLELVLRYIESPHTQTFLCRFDENNISVQVKRSFSSDIVTLKGSVQ
jgi:CubicO group peptidase (beta-lactamase class C family)